MPTLRGMTEAELLRRAHKAAGYVAVYAVGPVSPGAPVKIGMTSNPEDVLKVAQEWSWDEVVFHALIWTPGRPAAERVMRKLRSMLKGEHRRGSWFEIVPESSESFISVAGETADVQLFGEIERMRRLEEAIELAIRQARGQIPGPGPGPGQRTGGQIPAPPDGRGPAPGAGADRRALPRR